MVEWRAVRDDGALLDGMNGWMDCVEGSSGTGE